MDLSSVFAWTLATPVAPPQRTLLDFIAEGRAVGFVIIGLSFTAVVLIIAQLVRLRRTQLVPEEQATRLDELLRANDVQGAVAYCQAEGNQSFLTRVVGAGLTRCARSPFGFLELRTVLEEAGAHEVARLHRQTDPIRVIATVAPMLGLLGTTIGMVGAFDTLRAGEGVARPDQLAGDISVALITTVMGLIVAIPCTAVDAWLRNRIEGLAGDAATVVDQLASRLEGAPGAAPGRAPAGSPPQRPSHAAVAAQQRQTPSAPGAPGAGLRPGVAPR